jgi:acyl carrier protein
MVREFIVRNYLFGRENRLGDDDSFLEAGIIDSTGVLELVSFLEETFGIRIENEELIPDNLDSITKIARYVHSKVERAAQELPARQSALPQ